MIFTPSVDLVLLYHIRQQQTISAGRNTGFPLNFMSGILTGKLDSHFGMYYNKASDNPIRKMEDNV